MSGAGQVKLFLYPHTRRVVAKYVVKIRAESELLVGGGSLEQATSPFDIPVAKMPWGDSFIPYTPGSTLKGLLRSAAEEMMRTRFSDASKSIAEVFKKIEAREVGIELVEKAVIKLMQQFVSPDLVRAEDIMKAGGNDLLEKVKNAYEQKGADVSRILSELKVSPYACPTVVEGLACELPLPPYKMPYLKALAQAAGLSSLPYPCPVCLTFGAPGYASSVLVTSAYPVGRLGKDYFILARTHVAIDRYTGAAAQQRLFTVEYVTAGATFIGYLILTGPSAEGPGVEGGCDRLKTELENWAKGQARGYIPHYVIQCLAGELKKAALGRRKSAGMGQVDISIEKIDQPENCDAYQGPLKELCRWVHGADTV
jgi:CRISPR/Cas system CSM-associated protein Csm3 (group 7 of RAMP superfamily)